MKIVTNWTTLMMYAKALGDAEKSGNTEEIAKAKVQHDNYRDICLKADSMDLGLLRGQLL